MSSRGFRRQFSHYTLAYDVIDLQRYRFEGREDIDVLVNEPTKLIVCHAVDLWVHNVKVQQGEKSIFVEEIRYIEQDQTVTFVLEEEVDIGNVKIALEFQGILNDELRGFYRAGYEQNGEKSIMATSQFQACDARRAFVCWDEPAIKASFEISMATPVHLTAISNMHVLSTSIRPSPYIHNAMEKVWQFAETPIMSTYLVALIVGEFDYISAYSREGVLVNVYTPVGKSNQGEFALSVATESLSFFTKTFGLDYPLKKLDMLAIPDFAAGAMENWGCVTYREESLLIEPGQSSQVSKSRVALTVAHELAHQWFGNLVTMEWWTGLWLNEGFAHFMEYEAVNSIFPEWKMWGNFIQDVTLGSAFREDALLSSHMIEVEVNHPDEADEIFDAISYCKGASVIRMLREYLGSETFYKGIQAYLKQFSYQNAVTYDLWHALEEASGLPLADTMNTWTKQTGFPVVTLRRAEDNQLHVEQTRFFSNFGTQDDSDSRWNIPLTCVYEENSEATVHKVGIWFAGDGERNENNAIVGPESLLAEIQEAPWVKLNAHQQEFYIDNYCSNGWHALQAPCQSLVLDDVERMCLLNNIFTLTRAGLVALGDAFDFSRAFASDPNYLVWKTLSGHLNYYAKLFADEDFYPAFQKFVGKLYQQPMQALTWTSLPSDDDNSAYFRKSIISMLGLARDPAVIAAAEEHFKTYVATPLASPLASDLRSCVLDLVAAVKQSTLVYDQLRTLYKTVDLGEFRDDCLNAMGQIESKQLETLEWALGGGVRSQDIQYAFHSIARQSLAGANIAWTYIQDNWDELNKKYIPSKIGSIVCLTIRNFHTEAKANEIAEFFTTHKHTAFKRKLDTTLEEIHTKSACYDRDVSALATWLAEH
ncbi:puromycin-sensitive aminopeptidase [Thraustotheca clavata]|uniref:Aminopeptidase n=1 Tax=Thraustotheca clavata TaxID=74557 RepID=A0A1W0A967_9STRA|nr:puromycin-sensitive aminopeptidase [Thraustotheca clavata]